MMYEDNISVGEATAEDTGCCRGDTMSRLTGYVEKQGIT